MLHQLWRSFSQWYFELWAICPFLFLLFLSIIICLFLPSFVIRFSLYSLSLITPPYSLLSISVSCLNLSLSLSTILSLSLCVIYYIVTFFLSLFHFYYIVSSFHSLCVFYYIVHFFLSLCASFTCFCFVSLSQVRGISFLTDYLSRQRFFVQDRNKKFSLRRRRSWWWLAWLALSLNTKFVEKM